MNNTLIGKYKIRQEIDASANTNKVIVTTSDDELEFNLPMGTIVKEAYMTMFSKLDDTNGSMSGKYVQYTDLNGIDSHVIIDPSDLTEDSLLKHSDFMLENEYLYLGVKFNELDEHVSPIYINVTEKESE